MVQNWRSAIGAEFILDNAIADNPEQLRAIIQEKLQSHFRPEFLNRVDETLIFQRLSFEAIQNITEIQLQRLQRLLQERSLDIAFTPEAKAWLAQAGYDPAFGARPLRRAILHLVQNPLSMEILEGRFAEGTTIQAAVDPNGEKLLFRCRLQVAG